ncbi:Magnesium-protoporphyrin O-methyltransferase [Gracilariopsis chorda]|uniref:Magnesium-protoporphyrin O-methyltransferase n=1 Tax=Gracilariopsis chorda TaxID=448386 RepID=A0A2V3ISG2_9FLOR|nr:Magnesium-protoporphyrin O-methyltransferase [Gracilariopsis chorda]|eukprot:PXF44687.1 Magnesium-protoporphyrin O-methyltransferase [Gracilariopsis chorda]
MAAFVPSSAAFASAFTASRNATCAPLARQSRGVARVSGGVRMAAGVDDKAVVTEYFNNKGFDRWNRIYSEDGEVNKVQLDIRNGHAQTVQTVLQWFDQDDNTDALTVCDAGCGVGSLSLPLLYRGAVVTASDISEAMVNEAKRRAQQLMPHLMNKASFSTMDLESITGTYNTVCCIDVMIHYPTENAVQMIAKLAQCAEKRLIISFAPKTLWYLILKRIGDFFPGPSKATRAYLHAEDDVRRALENNGFKVRRTGFTGTSFYFSRVLEAVKE